MPALPNNTLTCALPGRALQRRRLLQAGCVSVAGWPFAGAIADPAADRARLQQAIAAMSHAHDFPLHGIEAKSGWHIGPFVAMGAEPYGKAVPKWWRDGVRYDEWHSLAAWFTVYLDARGSEARNSGIEIFGMESWLLRRSSRQWTLLRAQDLPTWQGAYRPNAVDSLRKSGGIQPRLKSMGFVATPKQEFMVHGGMQQTELPWERGQADFVALLVSIRHRLALIDPSGPDDRDQASMGVIAGADYYPWLGAGLTDLQASYNPGAGSGRLIKSVRDWRWSTVVLWTPATAPADLLTMAAPSFVY